MLSEEAVLNAALERFGANRSNAWVSLVLHRVRRVAGVEYALNILAAWISENEGGSAGDQADTERQFAGVCECAD
jgi:hypothetical protein